MSDGAHDNLSAELRERVTFEQPVRTSDTMGGFTVSWSSVASVWAEVKQLSAGQSIERESVQHPVRYRVRIRYRSDITPAMRISYRSKILRITGITDEYQRRQSLVIEAIEGEAP